MIAYMDRLTGLMDLRPFVDLSKRMSIWGIAVDGLVFKKTHEVDSDWTTATQISESKSRAILPDTTELDIGYYHRQAFNETVGVLKSCGIEADPWKKGWYWSREDDGDNAVVIDMCNGETDFVPKRLNNGYVRLVTHRVKTVQHISVRAALLYLNNGKFEWSLELEPERLSQLWGINVGGAFMRLTEESEKCDWYQGTEKAKTLSNEFCKVALPKQEDFEYISKYASSVNDSLAMISAYGVSTDFVSADFYRHRYLTSSEYGKDSFLSYDRCVTKKTIPCYCRFIGEEIK